MAVTEVNLLFTGRGGTDDFKKHRTYTRTFEVLTNDVNDAEQEVGAAAGIPALGTPFSEDSDAVVVSYDAQQSDDSPYIWYVTIKYDSEPPYPEAVDIEGNKVSTADAQENPLNEPATWKYATWTEDEPAIEGRAVDAVGNLVVPNPDAWTTDTVYGRGTFVKNGGSVFIQKSSPGVSAHGGGGPAGVGTDIADTPDAWAASTPYGFRRFILSNGLVYVCTQGGMSDAGGFGPAGIAINIVDGTCKWNFAGYSSKWDYYDTLDNVQNDPNRGPFVPIQHSGKLPFDPPVITPIARPILTVTKNMPFATIQQVMRLKNSVNLTAWKGVPPRCAKITSVEHDGGKIKNGITYVESRWEIQLNPDTWDVRILDAGTARVVIAPAPITGLPVKGFEVFKDKHGFNFAEPIPLDGKGSPLDPDADPVFLRFVPRQVRLIDFNTELPF